MSIPIVQNRCKSLADPIIWVQPIIAISTTAGTGSELSKGTILSNEQLKIKGGVCGRYLTAQVAIVDPFFTWTMPQHLTMETGFDALAHAIESYLSVKSNSYSRMLSEKAIGIIGQTLPALVRNLEQPGAREKMSYASMLMGMNLYNVGNCLPHRMQYPIGAATGTSHAAGLAALYPAWIEEEFTVSRKQINNVLQWLGFSAADNAAEAGRAVQAFLRDLGLFGDTLPNMGITKDMLPDSVVAVSGNIASDRLAAEDGVLLRLYEKAFDFSD
jgi:alcohol dehydrogenase class IV